MRVYHIAVAGKVIRDLPFTLKANALKTAKRLRDQYGIDASVTTKRPS